MVRRLFTLASLLSLALSLGTAAFWGWSYARDETLYWSHGHLYAAASSRGTLSVSMRTETQTDWNGGTTVSPYDHGLFLAHGANEPHIFLPDRAWSILGISYLEGSERLVGMLNGIFETRCRVVTLPYWVLFIAAFSPATALAFALRRAAAGHGQHSCSRCGYDLRASPGRCPECGAAAAEAKP